MMNWEMIGAISEMVGALGVIITLAYLAVQLRQNNVHLAESAKLTEASQLEATSNSVIEFRKMLLLNPDLMNLKDRGNKSFLTLDSIERLKYDQLMRIIFKQTETIHLRHLLFHHDPEDLKGTVRFYEKMLRMKGVREWLSQTDTDWRPEYRKWIESIIERVDCDKGL